MTVLRLHDLAFAECPLLGPALFVWVQGCPRRCPGCFNTATLDDNGGRNVAPEEVAAVALTRPAGLVLSGGEPFSQAGALAEVCERVRLARGDVEVLAYTGYRFDELVESPPADGLRLLRAIDVLVDGPFVASRATDEPLAGSDNQRVIALTPRVGADRIVAARRPRLQVSLAGKRLRVVGTGARGRDMHRLIERVRRRASAVGLVVEPRRDDHG